MANNCIYFGHSYLFCGEGLVLGDFFVLFFFVGFFSLMVVYFMVSECMGFCDGLCFWFCLIGFF